MPASSRPVRRPKPSDPLSSLLASGALVRLVLHLGVRPDDAQHFRALQRRTGLPVRSLQRELQRLERLGVVTRHRVGRAVRFPLDEGTPAWRALLGAVRELADPADVLRAALVDVSGVDVAFLFGSFARGDARPDSDVDVLILGEAVDEDALARAALDAGVLLARDVSVIHYRPAELARRVAEGSGFALRVLGGVKRWVVGDAARLEALVPIAGRAA
jgi:predicted nucleotidyltransferase